MKKIHVNISLRLDSVTHFVILYCHILIFFLTLYIRYVAILKALCWGLVFILQIRFRLTNQAIAFETLFQLEQIFYIRRDDMTRTSCHIDRKLYNKCTMLFRNQTLTLNYITWGQRHKFYCSATTAKLLFKTE